MKYVIIGNGPAGTFAAKEIRQRDSLSELIIISHDKYPFYSRPRLPEIISGRSSVGQLFIFPPEWYKKNKIHLRLESNVRKILTAEKQVILDDGENISYDRLLIATGSLPRRIPIKGGEGKNIFTLSSANDALNLNSLAKKSKQAVIIGAGFVGIEAAAGIASLGVRSTVIEFCDRILPRQLDAEASNIIRPRLESLGISFMLNSIVEEISDKERGKKIVITKDGKTAAGDFVLIATGIISNITLAEEGGINCNRSIIVNDKMETNINEIFAAGDSAEHNGVCYGIWHVSKEQGEIAGRNMAGETAFYHGSVPVTFLKIAKIDLASIGDVSSYSDTRVESISDSGTCVFRKAFIKNGKLSGAVFIGDTKPAMRIKEFVGKDFALIKDFRNI